MAEQQTVLNREGGDKLGISEPAAGLTQSSLKRFWACGYGRGGGSYQALPWVPLNLPVRLCWSDKVSLSRLLPVGSFLLHPAGATECYCGAMGSFRA